VNTMSSDLEDVEPVAEQVIEEEIEEVVPIRGIGTLVFGKWDAAEVLCHDQGLAPYINLTTVGVPHSGGRHANAWFGKQRLSLIERCINGLMRSGKYTGKKMAATKAFRQSLERIHEIKKENPLQVLVDAICHAAPMEEVTRIRFGAVSQPKAVDTSPSRRLDLAVRNLTKGSSQGTFKSKKSLTECIITEILRASEGDVASFAVAKREEVERIAASAR